MATIRSLVVKVGADTSDFNNKMKYLSKDLQSVGKKFERVGSSLTKGVTTPIVGATAGLAAIAIKAGETADELLTLSNQTGIATETLQGLEYASRFVDVEVSDMANGLAKVTKQMGTATKGGKGYIEIAKGMNVSIKDSNGNLKTSEQMFYDTIDAIGQLNTETEKEIATQAIFGKSYQDLMPLIQAGSQSLKDYTKEAKEMGLIMSEKDMKALGQFDDAMQKLRATFAVVGTKLAVALIPILEELQPVIVDDIIPAISGFIDNIAGVLKWFGKLDKGTQTLIVSVLGFAAALGPSLSGIGKMISLSASLVKSLGSVKSAAAVAGGASGIGKFAAGLSALLGPGGLIALTIAALVGLGIAMHNAVKDYPELVITADKKADKLGPQTQPAGGFGDFRALQVPELAKGGVVTKPTLVLAGEAGPEEIRPLGKNNTQTVNHTGTITVRGVNNRDELVAVVEQEISSKIMSDNRRMPGRASLLAIG